jgi:hypothetical protein
MDIKEQTLKNQEKNMVLHEKLYREFQEKMKDPRKAEA